MTRSSDARGDADTLRSFEDIAGVIGGTLDRTLIARLGIEVIEASPEKVRARMPVDGNLQPFGILHGGATAALCETVGSIGASLASPTHMAVGIELNVNHLRAVGAGWITASGSPVHSGRTIAVWDMRVTDDDDRLIAVGRLTLSVREQPQS